MADEGTTGDNNEDDEPDAFTERPRGRHAKCLACNTEAHKDEADEGDDGEADTEPRFHPALYEWKQKSGCALCNKAGCVIFCDCGHVRYCCIEHKRLHWKSHRRMCSPAYDPFIDLPLENKKLDYLRRKSDNSVVTISGTDTPHDDQVGRLVLPTFEINPEREYAVRLPPPPKEDEPEAEGGGGGSQVAGSQAGSQKSGSKKSGSKKSGSQAGSQKSSGSEAGSEKEEKEPEGEVVWFFGENLTRVTEGDPSAQYHLGYAASKGQYGMGQRPGVQRLAAFCLETAARQGHQSAQYAIGMLNLDGDPAGGVKQSYEGAASWLRAAANQGEGKAMNVLGVLYMNGRVVPDDVPTYTSDALLEQAVSLFRQAAEQHGHAGAQYHLGFMLLKGRGVVANPVLATNYFRLAAAQNHPSAVHALKVMSRGSSGVLRLQEPQT